MDSASIFFFLLFSWRLSRSSVSVRSVVQSTFKCKPLFSAKHLLISVNTFHPSVDPIGVAKTKHLRWVAARRQNGAFSVCLSWFVGSFEQAPDRLQRSRSGARRSPAWRIARLSVGVENWQLCLGSATAWAVNGNISISRASSNKAAPPLEIYNLTPRLLPVPGVSFCLVAKRLVNPIHLPDHQ